MIVTVDPERITERIFGGPHFIAMQLCGDGALKHPSGKTYAWAEINKAWMESRNAKPMEVKG